MIIPVGVNEKNVGVKTEEKVLALIKENHKTTAIEMAEKLGKSQRSIERAIRKLRQENRIKRVGSDKTGTWEVL